MNNKSRPTSTSHRNYHSEARSAQKEETRQHILDVLIEKMASANFGSVSMEEIAQAAGIGPATLYRHFPNREALLDGLSEEFNRRAGEIAYPRTPEEIVQNTEHSFAIFDQFPDLVKAFFLSELGRKVRGRGRARRIKVYSEALQAVTESIEEPKRTEAIAVIAYLASLQSWVTMTTEFDLTGEQAGQAVAWAIQTLLADLDKATSDDPAAER